MAPAPKLLVFAGSARRDSFNKILARLAADALRQAGAEVTYADLRDYPMPLYDGDLEVSEGLPASTKRFKDLLKAHDGLAIACPEYNSSITPLLKNTIDWCSRQEPNEPPLACFQGKVALLLAASPGALGGLRGLVTVRSILSNIGVLVLPEQLAIAKANEAFDANGALTDEKQRATLARCAASLARAVAKLRT